MTEARYWSVTNDSSMPWRFRRSKICPRQGLSTMGTIGFGRLIVRGRRRLPSPPAMTTACIGPSLVRGRAPAERGGRERQPCSAPIANNASRSWREYALKATWVWVRATPPTCAIRRVTMSASSSCSRARTIATKSKSPVTEYTSETPSTAARASPSFGSAPFSAVISTIAVITCSISRRITVRRSVQLEALDVDVVQGRLHVMGGFLKRHGPAPVERRLVRVEAVLARLLIKHVELLFALIDRELDAVTRSRADQEVSSERDCLC